MDPSGLSLLPLQWWLVGLLRFPEAMAPILLPAPGENHGIPLPLGRAVVGVASG